MHYDSTDTFSRVLIPKNIFIIGFQRTKITEELLRRWYNGLAEFLLAEHNLNAQTFLCPDNAHRIFNADEIGFLLEGTTGK